jgi:hypothetical protein
MQLDITYFIFPQWIFLSPQPKKIISKFWPCTLDATSQFWQCHKQKTPFERFSKRDGNNDSL